jgi:hypothetical protein
VSFRELLSLLTELDVRIAVHGSRLRLDAPTGAVDAEIRAEIASHRRRILELIPQTSIRVFWPARCPESRYRFGQEHAVLFPLLEKTVLTPEGVGVLFQVFADRARVAIENGEIAADFRPGLVLPVQSGSSVVPKRRASSHSSVSVSPETQC